ncbi:MAG: hypothetical protein JNG88_12395 [Phycisphaerales bacterium]|nr:hypothetical protein [Phycisphaerales bacterium]
MALIALCLIAGCTRNAESPDADAATDVAERGPLKLAASASPKQVWLADPIRIDAVFIAPADHVVRFPGAEIFGELDASAAEPVGPRPLPDGRNEWRREYTLRSLSAGALEIPPLLVKYAIKRDNGSEPLFDSELATGTLNVEVRSALTSQDSVAAPRDITGTLLPRRHWSQRDWMIAAVAGLSIAGIIAAILWLVRRVLRRPSVPELPEVWALRALSALTTADWEDQKRRQQFFYRLSEIVRQYIERKFGLTAPEMTTEEFLSALSRGDGALPYDKDRLRVFLESCDRVKYAAFQPRREDGEETLSVARAFVHTTAAAALASASRKRGGSERAA